MDKDLFYYTYVILVSALAVIIALAVFKRIKAGESLMPTKATVQREGTWDYIALVGGISVIGGVSLFYLVSPLSLYYFAVDLPEWLRVFAIPFGLVSLILWGWTLASMGTEWSPQLQLRMHHNLIVTGPFKRIRHPLYSAMVVFVSSLSVLTASWLFLILTIGVIVFIRRRVPREEKMMLARFGQEYQSYMNQTGEFFPKRQTSNLGTGAV